MPTFPGFWENLPFFLSPGAPNFPMRKVTNPQPMVHGWSSQCVLARATGTFGYPLGGDIWLPTCHHSKLGAGVGRTYQGHPWGGAQNRT